MTTLNRPLCVDRISDTLPRARSSSVLRKVHDAPSGPSSPTLSSSSSPARVRGRRSCASSPSSSMDTIPRRSPTCYDGRLPEPMDDCTLPTSPALRPFDARQESHFSGIFDNVRDAPPRPKRVSIIESPPLCDFSTEEIVDVVLRNLNQSKNVSASKGHLNLISKLGEGVFAAVWLAEVSGKRVAIKTMKKVCDYAVDKSEKERERLIRDAREGIVKEIEVFGRIKRHRNIVRYIGHNTSGTMLVFEACSCNLKDYVKKYRTYRSCEMENSEWLLPSKDCIKWTAGILSALQYLHGHEPPILHRDVKPDNILIDTARNAKLCDFNLSRIAGGQVEKGGWNMTGGVGSYRYMAPELLSHRDESGRAIYGQGCDVYSVAMVIYYMVTGRVPFDHKSASGAARAAIKGERPSWTDVASAYPHALTAVMVQGWRQEPEKRFTARLLSQILANSMAQKLKMSQEKTPSVTVSPSAALVKHLYPTIQSSMQVSSAVSTGQGARIILPCATVKGVRIPAATVMRPVVGSTGGALRCRPFKTGVHNHAILGKFPCSQPVRTAARPNRSALM